jgi:hypothetical protein
MFRFLQLEKRIKELEDQAKKMERDWLDRDLDWVELRARCKRLLDRTEKAAARVVESETAPTNGEEETPSNGPGLLLTAHQKEIQQRILRRRGGIP